MGQLDLFEDPGASSFKNFTIYRSSAGSGKTFTLVKEYLKIVLRDPQEYKHILAITFTNKATEEMKTRIIQYLMEMADGKDPDMKQVIQEEVKHYPQKLDIQDRAQKALNNILHNYSKFSVSTIDHFFSQLVRALARELKLSLNYEIDVDDDLAMKESLHLLYESLGHNDELRSWIRDFVFGRIEGDKGWQLDYTLIEFGKELFKEKFHQGFSKIEKDEVNITALRELERQLQTTEEEYVKQMKDLARRANKLIDDHGLSKEDFKGKSNGVANTFDKIINNKLNLTDTFKLVATGASDWYTATSPKKNQIDQLVAAGLGQLAREIYLFDKSHYQRYVTAKVLQKHIYSYGLLEAISDRLRIYRQSNNLMLLSQNSFLLREVISDREAPFLYEKLGNYYRHVLIDEFQDTSTYQWENLKPLVTYALDRGNHVLLVGDVKQSIYRWRGGDLNLLLNKSKDDLYLYHGQLEEKSLQENRRSSQAVVSFNNKFFRQASQALLLTKNLPENPVMLPEVYKEVEQGLHSKSSGGVEIRFFDKGGGDWRQQSLEYLTGVISNHIAKKGLYSDFLILCDRNLEVAEVSQHLSMLGIPVDSEQALNLAGNWVVRLLISCMYLQLDSRDQLARAEMAYLYQWGNQKGAVDFDTLFRESGEVNSGLLENYLPQEIVTRWDDLAQHNIYEWVSRVIPLLVESDQADPFISRFLEICLLQNNRGRTTIRDFLNWWEENKEDQMVIFPSHQEAVRVMTIHKAKGLEAPIVLIPWADFELKPRKDTLFWTDQLPDRYAKYKLLPLSFSSELIDSKFADAYRQELLEGLTEGLNTVYVAFTRARQRLYVGSYQPSGTLHADDLTHLYKLLWSMCTDPQWDVYWNADTKYLTVGNLDEPLLRKQQESAPALPIDRIRLGSYQNKIIPGTGDQRMFTLTEHYKAQHIREGIQVHTALERLQCREELPKVLKHMQSEAIITSSDRRNIQQKIEELFRQSVFSSFFDPEWKVFSEREITSNGRLYKPDRVIIKGKKAVVVDYKREKENPKHHKQVGDYGGLLERMGFKDVQKYLVYVGELRVVKV